MEIQLIRNATMKIKYANRTILTDPMFSAKGAIDPFAGIARNPTVELPLSVASVISGVELLLLSHTHPDHFDVPAQNIIPKNIPVICQIEDEQLLASNNFENILPISEHISWNGISITRTGGLHGSGAILDMMGKVSGFILQAENEPTVYWVGDVVLGEEVISAISKYQPDIIITHSGGAVIPGFDPILMDADATIKLFEYAPDATIVAVHLESLDHCTVGRTELRNKAIDSGIQSTQLLIPSDGEEISFTQK